jgi:hypothetical protein
MILQKLFTTEQELEELKQEIKRLEFENYNMKKLNTLTFFINEKKQICINGVGKYAFTLYKSQWEKLLDNADKLQEFLNKLD